MLSKNLKRRSMVPKGGSNKKRIILAIALIFSISSIAYGFYTFQKMKLTNDTKQADASIQTGDRPIKQTTTVYTTEQLSLRKEASKTSPRLLYIPNKTKLETIEAVDGWYKVKYSGKEGWVAKEYTTTEAPAAEPQDAWSYYTSKLGYKIKYPLGWKYQDYGTANQSVSLVAFSGQDLPTVIPSGSDFIAPITVEISSKSLADANKGFSSISGVVVEPIKVNSIAATKYTYTSALSNTQMTGIVLSAGGKTYVLNEGGGYSEDLLKMANTFSIGG